MTTRKNLLCQKVSILYDMWQLGYENMMYFSYFAPLYDAQCYALGYALKLSLIAFLVWDEVYEVCIDLASTHINVPYEQSLEHT